MLPRQTFLTWCSGRHCRFRSRASAVLPSPPASNTLSLQDSSHPLRLWDDFFTPNIMQCGVTLLTPSPTTFHSNPCSLKCSYAPSSLRLSLPLLRNTSIRPSLQPPANSALVKVDSDLCITVSSDQSSDLHSLADAADHLFLLEKLLPCVL